MLLVFSNLLPYDTKSSSLATTSLKHKVESSTLSGTVPPSAKRKTTSQGNNSGLTLAVKIKKRTKLSRRAKDKKIRSSSKYFKEATKSAELFETLDESDLEIYEDSSEVYEGEVIGGLHESNRKYKLTNRLINEK